MMERILDTKDVKEVRGFLYKVRRKWYDIGIELGISIDELDTISVNNQNDSEKCLVDMIKIWLKSINPPPTWNALSKALKSDPVGEAQMAKKGEHWFPSSYQRACTPHCVWADHIHCVDCSAFIKAMYCDSSKGAETPD